MKISVHISIYEICNDAVTGQGPIIDTPQARAKFFGTLVVNANPAVHAQLVHALEPLGDRALL